MIRKILLILVALAVVQGALSQGLPQFIVESSAKPSTIYLDDKSEDITIELKITPHNQTDREEHREEYLVDADVVLAIDCSASMYSNDENFSRRNASKIFIQQLNQSRDLVGIVLWNDTCFDRSVFDKNFADDYDMLDRIPKLDRGNSNFEAAIDCAIEMLDTSYRANRTNVSHSIILLTDGSPENSNLQSVSKNITDKAKSKRYRIYTVGFHAHPDSIPILENISNMTNAIYITANDDNALLEIYNNLTKTVPYEGLETKVLATNMEVIFALPPYLEEPTNIRIVPEGYQKRVNDSSINRTINLSWGLVTEGSGPLTVTFKTRLTPNLPININCEYTKFESVLKYNDVDGNSRTVPFPKTYINLQNTGVEINSQVLITITITIAITITISILFKRNGKNRSEKQPQKK